MQHRHLRHAAILGASAGVLLLCFGCAVGADLLNPNFVAGLGIDPQVVFPSAGTVILAFTNTTDLPAEFFIFHVDDPNDLTTGVSIFSTLVAPGATRNQVLFCPIEAIGLGTLSGQSAQPDSIAVRLTTEGEEIEVPYTGSLLVSGDTYTCGDVLDIQVVEIPQTGEEQESPYSIIVRVIPGR